MKLILSPKDTTSKITLENVVSFYQEGNTLAVIFEDGKVRNYPINHLWYWESGTSSDKPKVGGIPPQPTVPDFSKDQLWKDIKYGDASGIVNTDPTKIIIGKPQNMTRIMPFNVARDALKTSVNLNSDEEE